MAESREHEPRTPRITLLPAPGADPAGADAAVGLCTGGHCVPPAQKDD